MEAEWRPCRRFPLLRLRQNEIRRFLRCLRLSLNIANNQIVDATSICPEFPS